MCFGTPCRGYCWKAERERGIARTLVILTVPRRRRRGSAEGGTTMHDTGIVRRVDDLGRIVIPMELRRTLGIKVKDPMAIFVEGERIILEKHKDSARSAARPSEIVEVKDRPVCADCVAAIKKAV